MLSFLFWNLQKNPKIAPFVGRTALRYDVDVFLFAECPENDSSLLDALNVTGQRPYRVADVIPEKVRLITRLPPERLQQRFTSAQGEAVFWRLEGEKVTRLLLAAVHLPAKSGGFDAHGQQSVVEKVAREIVEIEDREGCVDTVLVGDMNMNPYEPGMVLVSGFHGLMTMDLAEKPDRQFRGAVYRRFYNPMWSFFGDRRAGAAGTHYWAGYSPTNHYWHMYDQVLVRPSLMRRLCSVQILTDDGRESFLKRDGSPDGTRVSDHLPILFRLEV
jgi:endonuclease/exonuclease/phosphatase family metal-dependent hydrolase